MGKRGPKPARPDSLHVTKKGYLRGVRDGRMRLEHDWVWEQANGPIPTGMQVHHKNEDKQDNRLDNLELMDALTHKRLHSGCELRDGVWWKPCGMCGEMKPVTKEHWYISKQSYPMYNRCRPCHCKSVSDAWHRRKNGAA